MKTYFITGGAGFIASTLTERLLKEGNKDNYKLYRGDIRSREDINRVLDENNIDVIVHLAAMAGVRPSYVELASLRP